MSEQSASTDPKPPADPRQPCAKCGSTEHTTGYHDGGLAPTGGGSSPDGYHDGGLAFDPKARQNNVATGYHDGGLAFDPKTRQNNVATGYHDGGLAFDPKAQKADEGEKAELAQGQHEN
jgi:hypothetical protein